MSTRWIAAGVVLLGALPTSLGCSENDCGYNQKYVPVHGGDQGEYVCLPDDKDDDDNRSRASLPPPSSPPSSSSSSSPPPPTPPPSLTSPPPQCLVLSASPTNVRVIPKQGKAPTVLEVWPSDGDYELAQASSYTLTGGGGSPIQLLRASLQVGGHVLVFGARGSTGGAMEANESFTLTLAPGAPSGTLTKVCQTSDGPIGWAMLPGPDGSNRSALLGWDAAIGVVTLLLVTPYGDVELLFVKKV